MILVDKNTPLRVAVGSNWSPAVKTIRFVVKGRRNQQEMDKGMFGTNAQAGNVARWNLNAHEASLVQE